MGECEIETRDTQSGLWRSRLSRVSPLVAFGVITTLVASFMLAGCLGGDSGNDDSPLFPEPDGDTGAPIGLGWSIGDAYGYEVNNSTEHQNVLLRVMLSRDPEDGITASKLRFRYMINDLVSDVTIVDNGSSCDNDWLDARDNDRLTNLSYGDVWDNSTACIQGSDWVVDDRLNEEEYFYIIENMNAPVGGDDELDITIFWDNESVLHRTTARVWDG